MLNRERLEKQEAAHTESQGLSSYADAVAARAKEFEPDARKAAEAWAEWIRSEARRLDPTRSAEALRFEEPETISVWELNKYMPRGLSASEPPEDPDA